MKKRIAKILLTVAGTILTRLPYNNFSSRLIDRLVIASEK